VASPRLQLSCTAWCTGGSSTHLFHAVPFGLQLLLGKVHGILRPKYACTAKNNASRKATI